MIISKPWTSHEQILWRKENNFEGKLKEQINLILILTEPWLNDVKNSHQKLYLIILKIINKINL